MGDIVFEQNTILKIFAHLNTIIIVSVFVWDNKMWIHYSDEHVSYKSPNYHLKGYIAVCYCSHYFTCT